MKQEKGMNSGSKDASMENPEKLSLKNKETPSNKENPEKLPLKNKETPSNKENPEKLPLKNKETPSNKDTEQLGKQQPSLSDKEKDMNSGSKDASKGNMKEEEKDMDSGSKDASKTDMKQEKTDQNPKNKESSNVNAGLSDSSSRNSQPTGQRTMGGDLQSKQVQSMQRNPGNSNNNGASVKDQGLNNKASQSTGDLATKNNGASQD